MDDLPAPEPAPPDPPPPDPLADHELADHEPPTSAEQTACTHIAELERQIRGLQATQAVRVAELHQQRRAACDARIDELRAERGPGLSVDELVTLMPIDTPALLGALLGVSTRRASSLIDTAVALAWLPVTAAQLRAGHIDWARATSLATETAPLVAEYTGRPADEALLRSFLDHVEAVVFGDPAAEGDQPAGVLSLWQVTHRARVAIGEVDPDLAAERHERAVRQCGVTLRDLPDGMARLTADGRADEIHALFEQIEKLGLQFGAERKTALQEALKQPGVELIDGQVVDTATGEVLGDTRHTPGRDRFDTLLAIVLAAGSVEGARPAVIVNVTVPFDTVLGLADHPGELAGYGPIPASLARTLAADGRWRLWLTDPGTKQVTALGTAKYAPTAALRRHIRAVHQTCAFPGCTRRADAARGIEIDHLTPWPRGQTTAHNLAPLCRYHHLVKTHSPGWAVRRVADGSLEWTTPTGEVLTTRADPVPTAGAPAARPARVYDDLPPF